MIYKNVGYFPTVFFIAYVNIYKLNAYYNTKAYATQRTEMVTAMATMAITDWEVT